MRLKQRQTELPIERWRNEATFHDSMCEQDTRWTAFRAYGLSSTSIHYARSLIGDLDGEVVVDCGCGDGENTRQLMRPGALVLAHDISFKMAKRAHSALAVDAKTIGCTVSCQQMVTEQLAYASDSIDVIFGVSILHHLEIPLAVGEIKRVLRPGGRAIFVEPLGGNPVARIYRSLTPKRHSDMESPLSYRVFELLGLYFQGVQHREFYLVSLGAAAVAFLRSRRLFHWSLSLLMKIDEYLFRLLPWLRRYAWITVIELVKGERE